jgi:hypothetical protein
VQVPLGLGGHSGYRIVTATRNSSSQAFNTGEGFVREQTVSGRGTQ